LEGDGEGAAEGLNDAGAVRDGRRGGLGVELEVLEEGESVRAEAAE